MHFSLLLKKAGWYIDHWTHKHKQFSVYHSALDLIGKDFIECKWINTHTHTHTRARTHAQIPTHTFPVYMTLYLSLSLSLSLSPSCFFYLYLTYTIFFFWPNFTLTLTLMSWHSDPVTSWISCIIELTLYYKKHITQWIRHLIGKCFWLKSIGSCKFSPNNRLVWFGLVWFGCFNGISTFLGYKCQINPSKRIVVVPFNS